MSIIDIQTRAAEYKFQLAETARKKQEWATTTAATVIETLDRIIGEADLQNFAHVIQAEGTYGLIVYMNLLYIEKGATVIQDSSDKENLKTGRQLAFKPMQNGNIGVYFCEHENGEYEAEFIDSHEPQFFYDDVLVSSYVEDFLEAVLK